MIRYGVQGLSKKAAGRPTRIRVALATCLFIVLAVGQPAAGSSGEAGSLYAWGDEALLPFPNDVYTRPDPNTPTGRHLVIPSGVWTDDLLDQAPFDARAVVERLEAQDGFSPNLPILLTVPAALAPDMLPDLEASRRADSPVALINLDALSRLPFRVFSQTREEDGKVVTLLVLSPYDRLEHGRRYAVIVRRGLTDTAGQPVPPPEQLSKVLSGAFDTAAEDAAWDPAQVAAVSDLAGAIEPLGYARTDIALLFAFTVESRESYVRPLKALDAFVEQRRDEVRYTVNDLDIRPRPLKGKDSARIQGRGTFTALRFVNDEGRLLEQPVEQDLVFLLRLPEQCPRGGCPVAIFGHGLSATRGTMFQVSDALASRGIATIATNTIWHNNFIQPFKVVLGARKNLDLFLATFLEHILRNAQLVEVIRQDLALRDLRPTTWIQDGRGEPVRLRPDRIFYIGQSLGGLCGVATCFLAPDIKAAVFDVAGGSAVDMLFDSRLMDLMGVPLYTFPGLDERDSLLLMPLAAYLFDAVDPLGYAPFLREAPADGQYPRLVTQQAGLGDGLVPNWTTDKLARALGLPLAWDRADAPDDLLEAPFGGPALRYFHFNNNWFLAHLELFHTAPVVADFFEWSTRWLGTDEDVAGLRPGR